MKVLEVLKQASGAVTFPQLASLIATIPFIFFPGTVLSQALSVNIEDDLALEVEQVSGLMFLPDFEFGAYDRRQVEPLGDLGRQQLEVGDYSRALALFKQALHVVRINNGLYHESQLEILDSIIASEIALQDWAAVDNHYSYLEHLYRRLYPLDDPRLEKGLREVSSWHVNALNINIDGRRVEHLREANKIFKLRLQIAEKTLISGDPRFDFLVRNIEICERQLYLASDLNKEMIARLPQRKVNEYDRRGALIADRD
ncbi:MAG: hypothetical protein HQ498_09710 [Pseudohongiella sp.]|nr:hypothetical protein [Pseudohongiella sp.]